ncbi:alkaline phosphatase family protein [Bradyrhizobium sp. CB1717]|uniref:alkaline phosphatase family protein n=1 Tax=Bradyrhizobium sp. CB1717 TaxID=3039154 RepID=UPI0024B22EB6|nr:alkaline phosphatase family protein [Bradyrhizobium sp. CB1717]WFU27177.1 alkaline phosphatase family protein [Bradyrhizobium sp. CB1717]
MKTRFLTTVAFFAAATALACSIPVLADDFGRDRDHHRHPHDIHTETPIKHLVIIFNENRSFDHYFATYPNAANPSGSIPFVPKPHTPKVNNLVTANLLVNNPNDSPANGTGATDPFRLDRTQANTRSQNHAYTPEQQAVDNGKADLFPKFTGRGTAGGAGAFGTNGQVMGYFDGNTVTAFWNYAQHFAMSDNNWTDTFGPSTPGMLEVVAAQTNGVQPVIGTSSSIADGQGGLTLTGDTDPGNDVCSSTTSTMLMGGKNIGDLLNAEHISWGSFMGGFDLTLKNANGTTGCARSTFSSNVNGTIVDYTPHHAFFQYHESTANPTHARPSSVRAIGHTHDLNGKVDPANHNYDLEDFYAAVKAGNFPAVSYIKMPAFQDGHAGNSDPLDEQVGNVELINFLQKQPEWRETAVIITYDDSDGWYDHQYVAPKSASYDPTADQVNGPGLCGLGAGKQPAPKGLGGQPVNGRCGPGTRVPLIVVSPYARTNYVSHTYTTQASVVRFIEDNWLHGQRLGGGAFDATTGSIMDLFDFDHDHSHDLRADALFLDPTSGTVITSPPDEHHHH